MRLVLLRLLPTASIRIKAYEPELLKGAPGTFKSADAKGAKELKGLRFTVQVAPEDCTGCKLCVNMCPAQKKDAEGNKTGAKRPSTCTYRSRFASRKRKNGAFFLDLPDTDPARYNRMSVKGSQFVRPLFEYSGACAGVRRDALREAPHAAFRRQAPRRQRTGCSSIYGGNLPTTPYAKRAGRGAQPGPTPCSRMRRSLPSAWRQTVEKFNAQAREIVERLSKQEKYAGAAVLFEALVSADQWLNQGGIEQQRARVEGG